MIADRYLQLRAEIETALDSLLNLSLEVGRATPWLDTLRGLLREVREPLLIVVVGEAKSGKSSLLNALFADDFSEVDDQPETGITFFQYGSEEKSIEVSAGLTERCLPLAFLHDFNIVDTPGTNIMVAEHQQITDDFVSRAELVFLVFSVVNPWTQSFWEFLGSGQKKWLKNAVFILQQADRRAPKELDVIRRHLEDTAMQKIGFTPPIFAVSARTALLNRGAGLEEDRLQRESQFGPLQEQINLVIMESGGRTRKLRSVCQVAQVVLHDVSSELRASLGLIAHDEDRLARVEALLEARKEQTSKQTSGLLREIERAYQEGSAEVLRFLSEKLSFARIWKILRRRWLWQPELRIEIEKVRRSVEQQAESGVQLLEAGLRGLWPQLHDIVDQQLTSDLKNQVPRAPADIGRQRRALLQSIQLALSEQISTKTIEEQLAPLFCDTSTLLRLSAGIVAGCGIAGLLAFFTGTGFADVAGLLGGLIGIIGAMVTFDQRRKILRTYERYVETKRAELTDAIALRLNEAIDLFHDEAAAAFQPLTAFCAAQRGASQPLSRRAEELQRTFVGLASRLR
jgi:GTPase SAR1 family protein